MHILIAEDEPITRLSLVRQLEQWGHEVSAAADGAEAWKLFSAGCFDLVITDWEMPHMSGLEMISRVRELRGAYTYVIILTSRSDKADVIQGIEAGADDFLSKPYDRGELRVRLLAGERIIRLERTLNRQNVELREANERIRSGLRAAARVQQSMLPRQNVITPHVRTAWQYVPTDELAGDAIGLHLVDDRYLITYILDVSGHGVPAALLSVSAMHSLEPIPPETSMLREIARGDGAIGTVRRPAHIAAELNRRFRPGENDNLYLTMSLSVLDTHSGRFHLTSAGHPTPLLLRGGQSIELPDAGGFPIAIDEGAQYEDACVQLQAGDRICLVSDGVLEQFDPAGNEQFGPEHLMQSLLLKAGAPPEQALLKVLDNLRAWAGEGNHFVDDVSLVVLDWLG